MTHNCEQNIESNMTPAHCRVCNKPMPHPTKTEEDRFEEKFPDIQISTAQPYQDRRFRDVDELKSFLHESNRRYARQVVERALPEEHKLPKTKCMNLENHTFGSCFQCEKSKGFNSALTQFKKNLDKELNK